MANTITKNMVDKSTEMNVLWAGLPQILAVELYPVDKTARQAAWLQMQLDLEHLTYFGATMPDIEFDQFEDWLVSRAVMTAIRTVEATRG